jgi:hypothetical protein
MRLSVLIVMDELCVDHFPVAYGLPRRYIPTETPASALRTVVAQWDRLSSTWCYMLVLADPVKVDLIFTEPHAMLPAWKVTAATLPRHR